MVLAAQMAKIGQSDRICGVTAFAQGLFQTGHIGQIAQMGDRRKAGQKPRECIAVKHHQARLWRMGAQRLHRPRTEKRIATRARITGNADSSARVRPVAHSGVIRTAMIFCGVAAGRTNKKRRLPGAFCGFAKGWCQALAGGKAARPNSAIA